MTDDTPPPWHIVGAGAMGTLFAHRLAAVGIATVLIGREGAGTLAHTLRGTTGEETRRQFPVEGPDAPGPVHRLLVTVKAPAVATAVAGLAPRLAADAVVLVLANGRGHRCALAGCLGPRPVYRGVTSDGAYRDGPTLTVHAGEGITRIGDPATAGPAPAWFDTSFGRLARSVWDPLIDRALWEKLAVNCVINGLTALYGCRNGALLTRPDARRELTALCAETAAALRALGQPRIAADLPASVSRVLRATAGNRSSMLADRLAGRETEIEAINGYLLARCAAQGGRLPRQEALVARIRELGRRS